LLVVAKAFRRSPLFFMTEKRLLQQYPEAGIEFLFAPTREHIVKYHLPLGFRVLGSLPVYARPYRLLKLAARFLGSGFLLSLCKPLLRMAEAALRFSLPMRNSGIRVEPLTVFEPSTAEALEKCYPNVGMHSRRTARALNWRFFECPGREYRIFVAREAGEVAGYIALRQMAMHEFDTLAIVDIAFASERPGVGCALLRQAHELALDLKADLLTTMFNPHSPMLPTLRRFGLLRTPEDFKLIVHQPKNPAKLLTAEDFSRWHYTWFEHDYV
jgi:hypothetical protein